MPEPNAQSYANHTKWDPAFHFFLAPIALINAIIGIVDLVRFPSLGTAWCMVLSIAAFVAIFKMRIYSLRVQDRVIRLEERLRLSQVLPEPMRSRIGDLSISQLVALRFASDAELPSLVDKTLSGNLKNADIKKAIVNWRGDYFRV